MYFTPASSTPRTLSATAGVPGVLLAATIFLKLDSIAFEGSDSLDAPDKVFQ